MSRVIVNEGHLVGAETRYRTRVEFNGRVYIFPERAPTTVEGDVAEYVRSMYAGEGLTVQPTAGEKETARRRGRSIAEVEADDRAEEAAADAAVRADRIARGEGTPEDLAAAGAVPDPAVDSTDSSAASPAPAPETIAGAAAAAGDAPDNPPADDGQAPQEG